MTEYKQTVKLLSGKQMKITRYKNRFIIASFGDGKEVVFNFTNEGKLIDLGLLEGK